MSTLDLGKLLSPISTENPVGDDLSYDEVFLELYRIAAGKPEQQVGNTVIPAAEPNWTALHNKSIECLARTKDLRAVMHLAMSATKLEGLSGFRDGIALLRGIIEKYWDKVHPQLDPEDGNDPTLRINTLAALTDRDTFLRAVRETPLTDSRTLGRFSLRDIEMAAGETPTPPSADPNAPKPEMKTIDAAFEDTPTEFLQTRAANLANALADIKAIDNSLTKAVGAGQAFSLKELESLLARQQAHIKRHLENRPPQQPPGPNPDPDATPIPPIHADHIRCREDVVRMLERICDWYVKNEPGSPVPVLLNRAQRMVTMNFLQIVEELTPEAVKAVKAIGGVKDAK